MWSKMTIFLFKAYFADIFCYSINGNNQKNKKNTRRLHLGCPPDKWISRSWCKETFILTFSVLGFRGGQISPLTLFIIIILMILSSKSLFLPFFLSSIDVIIPLHNNITHENNTVLNEPVHEISNNEVCATSKASHQPAHTRSLIRAFASRLSII